MVWAIPSCGRSLSELNKCHKGQMTLMMNYKMPLFSFMKIKWQLQEKNANSILIIKGIHRQNARFTNNGETGNVGMTSVLNCKKIVGENSQLRTYHRARSLARLRCNGCSARLTELGGKESGLHNNYYLPINMGTSSQLITNLHLRGIIKDEFITALFIYSIQMGTFLQHPDYIY